MINKLIKINWLSVLLILLLFISGIVSVFSYIDEDEKYQIMYNSYYEECLINDTDQCAQYSIPFKTRDTVSTFDRIVTSSMMRNIQIFMPLILMAIALPNFYNKFKYGYLKNSLVRDTYRKTLIKMYFDSIKFIMILPIFFLILFIISYILSRNFDYSSFHQIYQMIGAGEENSVHYIRFIISYMLTFALHGIFWINLAIFNVRGKTNILISIVISYIEYSMIFSVGEIILVPLFRNTSFYYYFSLSMIWSYYGVTRIGMIIEGIILAFISTLIVYLHYRNQEKVLEEIEK